MIAIPGSLSFAKLLMMSSFPAKSAGDARYMSQDPIFRSFVCLFVVRFFVRLFVDFPIQSQLQMQLGVCSFYVEFRNIQPVQYNLNSKRNQECVLFMSNSVIYSPL